MGAGQLRELLDALCALGGAASAAEALVADRDTILFRHAAGFRVGGESLRAGVGARFDAASLTKPWIATLALLLDRDGTLPLTARLGELDGDACPAAGQSPLEALLRHRSGIAAWTPLWVATAGRTEGELLLRVLLGERFWRGRGDEPRYSDLGYLLWGLLAERASGSSLADLLDRRVAGPLGLPPIGALAAHPPAPVECRLDNGREVELAREQGIAIGRQAPFRLGQPQDGNARQVGRLTAHAGLFLTAEELLALGREWLAPGKLLTLEEQRRALAGSGGYALGWARQSATGSSGNALGPRSFGHTGFTGGSLWIDPERERIDLLLSHRLSSRADWNEVRREFHRRAAEI